MCKEMPVVWVDRVVDTKRIIGRKWRAKEEERHKGLLTQRKHQFTSVEDMAFYIKILIKQP
jgi:hypothetical protein